MAQTAIPVLIGTKYDTFASLPREEQEEVTKQAKRFSKAMHAPLVSDQPIDDFGGTRLRRGADGYRSSARHHTPSTYKRSSRSCSPKHST